jgi:hypothetical protein
VSSAADEFHQLHGAGNKLQSSSITGPACGKTTNLQYIYERTNPAHKGKMISLATETERTLFFDFLPPSLGEIRGFKTRFHLYTVFSTTRRGSSS